MKKDPKIFLGHIIESIREIEKNASKLSKEDFYKNITIQDAVAHRPEIIGEATKNLSKPFKRKYPNIEWKKIAG